MRSPDHPEWQPIGFPLDRVEPTSTYAAEDGLSFPFDPERIDLDETTTWTGTDPDPGPGLMDPLEALVVVAVALTAGGFLFFVGLVIYLTATGGW